MAHHASITRRLSRTSQPSARTWRRDTSAASSPWSPSSSTAKPSATCSTPTNTKTQTQLCTSASLFFHFYFSVWEISVTDVVFCLTLTGACPTRGVWPRGATELPVGTDDEGVSALRSFRAASGRRAVVSLLLICVWAICIDVVFCSQGTDGTQRRLLALALHRRLMRGDG